MGEETQLGQKRREKQEEISNEMQYDWNQFAG